MQQHLINIFIILHVGISHVATSFITTTQGHAERSNIRTCRPLEIIPNGLVQTEPPHYLTATYSCNSGYMLSGPRERFCKADWTWSDRTPKCIKKTSKVYCKRPRIRNSILRDYEEHLFSVGDIFRIICKDTYHLSPMSMNLLTCDEHGQWNASSRSHMLPVCQESCRSDPPAIQHGDRYLTGNLALYSCREGYQVRYASITRMHCISGQWTGLKPECVANRCPMPTDISYGNWKYVEMTPEASYFAVGTKIYYLCLPGYFLKGSYTSECVQAGSRIYWSQPAPVCIRDDNNLATCQDPGVIANGKRRCVPHACDVFYTGVQIHYYCELGFEPLFGQVMSITCDSRGDWTGTPPTCKSGVLSTASSKDKKEKSTGGALTILLTITGSVLGALTVVVIIVAFHRRRKEPRAPYRTIPVAPPTYRRNANGSNESINEHDRMALIAYADGVQVVLPSYDEAIRPGRRRQQREPHLSHEYAPLPNLPDSIAGSGYTTDRSTSSRASSPISGSMRGEAGSVRTESSRTDTSSIQRYNRNSLITNASINRETLSDTFGSIQTIDTANISDAMSSVTIDTYRSSNSSNPSLAISDRGHAGSRTLSRDSLEDEDAPLIEGNSPKPISTEDLNETDGKQDEK